MIIRLIELYILTLFVKSYPYEKKNRNNRRINRNCCIFALLEYVKLINHKL